MRIEELKDQKVLIKFNGSAEFTKLVEEHVSKVFDGWTYKSTRKTKQILVDRVNEKGCCYINMETDGMFDEDDYNGDKGYYKEYTVINASELFESKTKTFHYINNDGKKTSTQAEKISDIKDLKQLLYTFTN